jgi:hypothetical protein
MTGGSKTEPGRDVRAIEREIDNQLVETARAVIRRHLDVERDDTADFLAHPDARSQHQTQWHQWGIITHTRIFLRHLEGDVSTLLAEWGLLPAVDAVLCLTIDGASRWELLRITVLLHDIGKFGARFRGRERFHFTGHERLSGTIIREELDLEGLGLSPAQVEYIARTAEDHFVLGLLRKRARERGQYELGFTNTPEFVRLCVEIREAHPDDFVEVGVLFLGDSLAKVEPSSGPPAALEQHDVNVHVAHRYLSVVLGTPPYNEAYQQ